MKAVILIIIQIFILNVGYAAKEEAPVKETAETVDKRLYSEEEFQSSVLEEVEKYLKKIGNNKIIEFSKELIKKEQDIKLKELKIVKNEEQLKMNESNFKQQLVKFRSNQNKFIGCIDEKQKDREKRVSHMVEVISSMKPANSASLLSVQDVDISVQILEKLDPVKVSKIFNLMDKEISARLQKQYMNMKR
jgi:flagellar motility protein MotE (MotC chaperone)